MMGREVLKRIGGVLVQKNTFVFHYREKERKKELRES